MYSSLTIVGAVGKDPEGRFTPSGQQVTNFSVATNRQYKKKSGEQVKTTTWHRVQTWGKLAEICQAYVKKGMKVLVEGELVADENGNPKVYKKNDGTYGANFEVNARSVLFLSRAEASEYEREPAEVAEEDFPF